MRRLIFQMLCALMLTLGAGVVPAGAQSSGDIGIRGFGMFGNMVFTAEESFKTVLDRNSGPIFGGGGTVLLPWGIFVEIGAWRFKEDGERVFIGPNDEIFKLGIPVEITVIPLEVTAGYRFTTLARRVVPYGGVGYSRYRYKETSQFADAAENVDERFTGFHVTGGVEFLALRWLAIGGEATWSSVADALGEAGVSKHFNEDNLGGTSVRLKISVGR